MSQAKARLMTNMDEIPKNKTVRDFQATNEKIKRIELDNINLKTQIDDLKFEIENKRGSENIPTVSSQNYFENTSSFKILSGEIEELRKKLEIKNLENLFNEKNFSQNFAKIQQAYKFKF